MNMPDVIGFTLEDARVILAGAGISIGEISVLSPPKDVCKEYSEFSRVIRLGLTDENRALLLVSNPSK